MKPLRDMLILGGVVMLAAGCDDRGTADVDAGADAGADAGPDYLYPVGDVHVAWEPCSFIWGADDGEGECALTAMPLNWNDPENGKTIEIYAKRRLSTAPESEGQMWFLHGGPGASGVEGLPPLLKKMQGLYPELDVYTIDHRGVGGSAKLVCPGDDDPNEDHLPECLAYLEEEYGDDLHGYSTSDSAIDLAAYIEATREEGKKVLVWGGSYGTYIGHRYLQIFPDQSDGMVLEGIAPADSTFIWSAEEFDKAGKGLFARCAGDPYCSTKLGKDPIAGVEALFNAIYTQNHCSAMNYYQYYIPYVMTTLLYYHPYHNAVPAIAYRAARCSPQDIWALNNLLNMVYGEDSTYQDLGEGYSSTLYNNIVYSEMWEHPNWPDEESLLDYFDEVESQAVFNAGSGEYMYEIWEVWPRYTDELWDDEWAVTATPMLMLQGMLDPATGYEHALTVTEHFSGPAQTFVAFPTAGHNVSSGTPVSSDPEELHCGRRIMVDFMMDPGVTPDLSCVTEVLPNDFEGDEELADMMFGAAHLWENGASYSMAPGTYRARADLEETMREVRARARRDLSRWIRATPADRALPALPPPGVTASF